MFRFSADLPLPHSAIGPAHSAPSARNALTAEALPMGSIWGGDLQNGGQHRILEDRAATDTDAGAQSIQVAEEGVGGEGSGKGRKEGEEMEVEERRQERRGEERKRKVYNNWRPFWRLFRFEIVHQEEIDDELGEAHIAQRLANLKNSEARIILLYSTNDRARKMFEV